MIEATRAAGLARLENFLPRAGRAYAAGRNTSLSPAPERHVSALSPFLRRRLVLESEVVARAHETHGEAAGKFVEEVFWRTYWKGHLEQHPSIWTAYRTGVAHGFDRLAVEGGLRRVFHDATEGRTGIAPFDTWAQQLVAENWLHNHVRMWFASIWIFTLRLPWELGADFFARHLLDADPASNTLSWRWVAGLHTPGKHYVARADNIARYTEGRFEPHGDLDETPEPLPPDGPHPAVPLAAPEPLPAGPVALLLHGEDLCAEWLGLTAEVRAVAGMTDTGFAHRGAAEPPTAFARAALADGVARATAHFDCPGAIVDDAAGWVAQQDLPVVSPLAPLGPVVLPPGVIRVVRPWDARAWPACRRGYFQLRTRIPDLLGTN